MQFLCVKHVGNCLFVKSLAVSLKVQVIDDGVYGMCSISYTYCTLQADWVSEDLISHIPMLIEGFHVYVLKTYISFHFVKRKISVMHRQNHMHFLSAVFHYAKISVEGEEACSTLGEGLHRRQTSEGHWGFICYKRSFYRRLITMKCRSNSAKMSVEWERYCTFTKLYLINIPIARTWI